MLAARTMKASSVMAKMAGIEFDREGHVGAGDDQQHREDRGGQSPAALVDEDLLPAVAVGAGHEAVDQPQQPVLAGVHRLAGAPRQPVGREEQERAEDVDHPVGGAEGRRADGDEDAAEDQRPQHPEQQHPRLDVLGHREVGEDHGEDEQVVDGEAPLDQVAGDVLAGRRPALGRADDPGEAQPQRHPREGPERGGLGRDLVAPPGEHQDVDRRQHRDGGDEGDPCPDGGFHAIGSFGSVGLPDAEGLSRPVVRGRRHRAGAAVVTMTSLGDTPLAVQGMLAAAAVRRGASAGRPAASRRRRPARRRPRERARGT